MVENLPEPSEWHCPKCGVNLPASGTVTFAGRTLPVFQCETCTINDPVFGEMALTFSVADGEPFDPAAADDALPL